MKRCDEGSYTAGSRNIKKVPPRLLNKYFALKNGVYHVSDTIKNIVKCRYLNIAKDALPGEFDVIFCKNVMMYFSEDSRRIVFDKLVDALNPGGFLFMGETEIAGDLIAARQDIKCVEGMIFRKQPAEMNVPVFPAENRESWSE